MPCRSGELVEPVPERCEACTSPPHALQLHLQRISARWVADDQNVVHHLHGEAVEIRNLLVVDSFGVPMSDCDAVIRKVLPSLSRL